MAKQIICDDCGEIIDETQPYWSVRGTKVQLDSEGALVTVEPEQGLEYHEEHLPRDQLDKMAIVTHPIVEPESEPDPEEDDKEKDKDK